MAPVTKPNSTTKRAARRFLLPAVIRYPLIIVLGVLVGVLGSYVLRKVGY